MPDRRTKGGHESGDTAVSKLQVPEVLFKPALGMPRETAAAADPETSAHRIVRWLGASNCAEVFTLIGWDHPDDELDHTRIRGLGPDGDQTAYWGDLIDRDNATGVCSVIPNATVTVPRSHLDDLHDEVDRLRGELNPLRDLAAHTGLPGEDEEFYQPGAVYVSENGWWRFTCQVAVAGVALGVEECLQDRLEPRFTKRRVWMTVKPEGCWTKVEDADA